MKHLSLVLLIAFFYSKISSQTPTNYFKSPLKIPLILSGTFGELRSNHFHSGLDLKTQGREGLTVFSAAKGYVSRIKISAYGYGKAIYIQHPNGYTTVYAHLKKLAPKIETYLKNKQYKQEKYAIELFPEKEALPVNESEMIAYSGNSGSSGGPHLHFEIRDAQQRPMNPMLFGIDIKDTRKPLVNTVWLYPLDQNAQINGIYHKPYRLKIKPLKNGDLLTNTVKASGNIGIAVSSVDQQNDANNRNGYYSIETYINGTKNFELEMKRFSFSETRYINRMIDFEYYKKNRSRITKLFIEPNNPLSIYKSGNGHFNIEDSLSYHCNVFIKDFKNNTRKISIPIKGKQIPEAPSKIIKGYSYYAEANKPFEFSNSDATVYIPKGALYESTPIDIKELPNGNLKIHDPHVPLHKYMNISFQIPKKAYAKQSYIGRFYGNNPNKPSYVGAKRNEAKISARTRDFGNFGVFIDSIKPRVKALNFSNNKWISKNKTLKVWISDSETGIKTYKAMINNKFALMEYDYKKKTLTYNFEDQIHSSGKNELKVYVEDNVGNNTIFERTFFRK